MTLFYCCFFYLFGLLSVCSFADAGELPHLASLQVPHDDLPFADMGGGILCKFPLADPYSGMYTVICKSGPGGRLAKHRHLGSVYGVTLAGKWSYEEDDWMAEGPGSFVWETPGAVHSLVIADDAPPETLIFFIVYGALEFYSDDDEPVALFDWQAAAATQYGACEAAGVKCPDLTRPRKMAVPKADQKEEL